MHKIDLKIATPEKVVYRDEEIDSITLPTQQGEITVLPGHIPLVSALQPGEVLVRKGKEEEVIAVSGGFLEVLATKVVILADTAERSEEIDVKRAEEAIERAEELKKTRTTDAQEFAALTAKINKELARVKVGRKRRGRIEQRGGGMKKYTQDK